MSSAAPISRYTLEQYLAMEPEGDIRHEFIAGEIFAMVGSSLSHNIIVMNLGTAIRTHLRGTGCRVVANDRKVLIADAQRVYYPDLLVTCVEKGETIDDYTETQPTLIVEVLSPSTAAIDRREKRLTYQQLGSLRDYVLVAQDQPMVEVYHRQQNHQWVHTEYRTGEMVILASIELQISMSVIYEDIVFKSADKPAP